MKTIKTLAILASGVLFAGVAHAQNFTQPALTGPGSLNIKAAPTTSTTAGPYDRAGYANQSYVEQAGSNQYSKVDQAWRNGNAGGNSANLIQARNSGNMEMRAFQDQTNIATGKAGGNAMYLEQRGDGDVAAQYQYGSDTRGKIVQRGSDRESAFQSQTGYSNDAEITQTSNANVAQQVQRSNGGNALSGHDNYVRTTQGGIGYNWSVTDQRGSNNTAIVTQQ